jgi:tripartite-type tricarboxylate transporter receptor subunit TctC
MHRRLRHTLVLGWLLCGAFPGVAFSQAYPDRPIRLVIPYPPGGATDLTGRLLQSKLAATLHQPIVIDNRGGATGAIGTRNVAQSAPDGYTLLFTVGTDMALNRIRSPASSVDPEKELTPIAPAVASVSCIAASTSAPVGSLSELVSFARNNPGKLSYGTPGIGSNFHVAGELLKLRGVELLHVPFKGTGPAMAALVAGQIDLAIGNLQVALTNARSGKIKVLATLHATRFEGLPDVPAVAEAVPGSDMPPGWYGFFGPARLPRPIVERLNAEVNKALASPEVRAKLQQATFTIMEGTPQQFAALVRDSMATYANIVKATGIRFE